LIAGEKPTIAAIGRRRKLPAALLLSWGVASVGRWREQGGLGSSAPLAVVEGAEPAFALLVPGSKAVIPHVRNFQGGVSGTGAQVPLLFQAGYLSRICFPLDRLQFVLNYQFKKVHWKQLFNESATVLVSAIMLLANFLLAVSSLAPTS
jgi:hypothetical protein